MSRIFDLYTHSLKNYASVKGRASRTEYALFTWSYILLSSIPVLGPFIFLALLIPVVTVGVRRLHDLNRSGWRYIMVILVPLVFGILAFLGNIRSTTNAGIAESSQSIDEALSTFVVMIITVILIAAIILSLFKGTDGPNRYGEAPQEKKPQ